MVASHVIYCYDKPTRGMTENSDVFEAITPVRWS
jgi:hypothetical protein